MRFILRKNKLLIVLLVSFIWRVNAQPSFNNDINHKRYWYYRARLVNDFVKVGPNPGESLPLSRRKLASANDINLAQQAQVGADAVSQLGEYISVLATEYALLRSNNQKTENTIKELYYALEAFNRLDYSAEQYWGKTNALDGFFIREDLPCDFFCTNKVYFNYELSIASNGSLLDPNCSFSILKPGSGFSSQIYINDLKKDDQPLCNYLSGPGSKKDMAMSNDQIHPMLAGLALINKYFVNNEVYTENSNTKSFLDNETKIRNEARKMSVRIINNLKRFAPGWLIEYPDCSNPNLPSPSCFIPNSDGGDASAFSFPIAESVGKINKDNNSTNSYSSASGYHNAFSISPFNGIALWDAACGYCYPKIDDAVKIAWEQATCNCNYLSYPSPLPGWNLTTIKINPNAVCNSLDWSPILRSVLHGGQVSSGMQKAETFIKTAPCNGPYNYKGTYDDYNWSSTDLIEHPERRGGTSFPGDYNGLDYMLYHNLYYLYNNQINGNPVTSLINNIITFFTNLLTNNSSPTSSVYYAVNLMDNEDGWFWPRKVGPLFPILSGVVYGTAQYPATLSGFQSITSNAKVFTMNSPATFGVHYTSPNVTYRAGKEITLTDGFEVQSGSEFTAIIKRYNCNSGVYNDYSRVQSDSTADDNVYYTDNFFTEPSHYVEYPDENDSISLGGKKNFSHNLGNNLNGEISSFIKDISSLVILPNPFGTNFTIEFPINSNVSWNRIEITNELGNIVYKLENFDTTKNLLINLENSPDGLYFVNYHDNTGTSEVRKVIKQN